MLATQPVPLEADFPIIPGFTVPPLEPTFAETIKIYRATIRRGGYADVYQGTWVAPGNTELETVAVKIFRPVGSNLSPEEDMEQRIRIQKRLAREVTIWQSLQSNHSRIAPLYGYTFKAPIPEERDRPCVISPWRAQGNLAQYLLNNPRANKLELLVQAGEALNVLHTAQPPVVHLDIKPDNFLVNDLDEVELCDFGISRVLNGAQSGFTTGPHAGTFAFEAPEYMLGSNPPTQYTTDLDVYSFGCCILTVLSGKPPFAGLPGPKLLLEVVGGQRPQPIDHPITVPRVVADEIWALMNRCWNHDPTSRPTMTQVVEELQRISLLNGTLAE